MAQIEKDPTELLTCEEAIEILRCGYNTLYRLLKEGKGELKERSIKNKKYMIDTHVLPYFGGKRMNEIKPLDIIQWQNAMREKGFSQTYLRMIQNQRTALFTYGHLYPNEQKKLAEMLNTKK